MGRVKDSLADRDTKIAESAKEARKKAASEKESPFESGVCYACLNFDEKGETCLIRPNWGDRIGEVDKEQPCVSCRNVKLCHRGEYILDYDKIFRILKEYKDQKEKKK